MRVHVAPFYLAWVLLLWMPLAALAAGESLPGIRSAELPALPAPASALVSNGTRLIALSTQGAWMHEAGAKGWQPVEGGAVAGAESATVARGGGHAVLLRGDGRVESMPAAGGKGAARAPPELPEKLTRPRGAILAGTLHVTGLAADGTPRLYSIDLVANDARWARVGTWPEGAGEATSVVAQTHRLVLSARAGDGAPSRIHEWTAKEGWRDRGPMEGTPVEGGARAIGQAHVLYLVVAADGTLRLRSFHTITGSWAAYATLPAMPSPLAADWGAGFAWTAKAQPAARVDSMEMVSGKHHLNWLDWAVIVIYLVSMLGMGLYFYLREKRASTADFFVGGRKIPFWAAGVSLYAANTSSISYIAIPAKAFETNWTYLTNNLVAVCALMFVAVYIVPLLRRLDLMSVYAYLETRFHPVIRTLASLFFIFVQIGSRMSVILFLPSLAIATITGIDVTWSILIMGVFTMIYTALGGMKAVVWTDIVQLVVKMGGIAFAIAAVALMLEGGTGELLAVANAESKMKLFDFSLDLTKATVWGFIFLVLFDVVLTFPKDQVLMQRVLSTKDARDAGRSIWTFAAIMIPGGFMFYFTGTALYAFYKAYPERLDPLLNIDATFPLFIAAELPMGVRGLIFAGILAAAMATLSSIMNSVATVASVDFYEKWVKKPDQARSVRIAEAMTVVTGLAGMGVALLLSRYDIHSLFDVSIELAGLLAGGIAGAYTLGMFTRRANWQGVVIGVVVAIALTTTAWAFNLVHPYFYLGISIMLCIVVGYLASYFFPAPAPASLVGLTIYDRKPA